MKTAKLLVLGLLLGATPASAATIVYGENLKFNTGVLMQIIGDFVDHGSLAPGKYADNGFGWGIGIRRMRVSLSAEVFKAINFSFQTESPNIALGGYSTGTSTGFVPGQLRTGSSTPIVYILDAAMSYTVAREFKVDVGQQLIPFSYHVQQASARLVTLDSHNVIVKFPTASGTPFHGYDGAGSQGSLNWRDQGVKLSGSIWHDRFQYQVGVFGGVRGTSVPLVNPGGLPLVAGMVRWWFWDAEYGNSMNHVHYGRKKILSIGFSAAWQKDGNYDTSNARMSDYLALEGDLILDYPFGADRQHEITFMATGANFSMGSSTTPIPSALAVPGVTAPVAPALGANGNQIGVKAFSGSGTGVVAELGYRWKKVFPFVCYEGFFSTSKINDYTAIRFGTGYLFNGPNANLKVEFAFVKDGTYGAVVPAAGIAAAGQTQTDPASAPFQFQTRIQAQILF